MLNQLDKEDTYETRNNCFTVRIIVKGPHWANEYSTCALIDADGIEYKIDGVKELLTTAWQEILKKQGQNE